MLQTCPRSKRVAPRTRDGNHLQKWSRASSPVAAARRVRGWSRSGSGVGDGHRRRALGGDRSTGWLRENSHCLSRWYSNYPNYIGRWRSGDGYRNGRCSGSGECWHGCRSSGGRCRHGGHSSGLAVGGDRVRRRGGGGGARGRRRQRRRLRRTSIAGHPDVVGAGASVHLRARRRCGRGARGRCLVGRGGGAWWGTGRQVRPRCVRGVSELCLRCVRDVAEVCRGRSDGCGDGVRRTSHSLPSLPLRLVPRAKCEAFSRGGPCTSNGASASVRGRFCPRQGSHA